MSAVFDALARLPRAELSHTPTPIDPLPRLGAELGVTLSVKRDDMTGLSMGGNKARQLAYYFGEALAQEADSVLITGAVQSNFCQMAVAAAARHGMAAHVQYEDRVPAMGAGYHSSGNVLLIDLMGATRHPYPHGEDEAGADARVHELAAALKADGKRPYIIPLAPDNPPLGAMGYIEAGRELAGQIDDIDGVLDAVVCGSGSGMTHAGLLVGLRAAGAQVPVIGVCVRRPAADQTGRIAAKCRAVTDFLGVDPVTGDEDVRLFDGTLAPGYGRPTPAIAEAMKMAASLEGLFVDPVYTGKTLAGLIAMARDGTLAGKRVLFLHTGGLPALFAYETELRGLLGDDASA